MSDLPADCVAQILRHFSLLERLTAGRVSKSWLLGSRSRMANEKLLPEDLTGKSLPLARKYAYEYAKSVTFGTHTDILRCVLPSVEHIEIPLWRYTGKFFVELITKVLDASKIISFERMDIRNDADRAIPKLALLTSIRRLKIDRADSQFILSALRQLRTLVSVEVEDYIGTASLVNILTSQEPPVLWKDVNLGLRNAEHTLLPLLASRMPHLKKLTLWCRFLSQTGQTLRISHPTLEWLSFNFLSMDQKINIDVPKATYCSIVALYDDAVELIFESVSMLQRLDLEVGQMRSFSFSDRSPPTRLKHVSLRNFGPSGYESPIVVILARCPALETLHLEGGKYLENFHLQDIASTVLREISIVNCPDLRKISISNNTSLEKLQHLNFSDNAVLSLISLDAKSCSLPILETMDVSQCLALDVKSLALFCSQLTALQKLTAVGLRRNALRAALAAYPTLGFETHF